jgi:Ca-activated chloride channel family protein
MKLKTIICLSFVICHLSFSEAMAQQVNVKEVRRYVKRGNRMMQTGQRDKAYEQYRKAYVADSTNTLVNYNLATSMFPDEWKIMKPDAKRDSVMETLFMRSADAHSEDNPLRRSMSYHNIGVMHQIRANQSGDDQQKYQELQQAIEAYKQTLRNNPHDDEARYNLVLCQRQLPKGSGGGQQNQDGDQQQEQQKDEQQDQQQQNQQQDQQQQPPQQQEQNQEWIEQMLNAAEQREKQTRRRLDEKQQNQNQRRSNEKNW